MKEKTAKRIFDFFNTPIEKQELHEAENGIDELYALCDDPMQCPVKLVDEQLRFTDLASVQDLFVENTGFLVVGVIGLQGCGKSTLLNVLANQLTERTTPFDGPFKVQSMQSLITNSPETGGIDLYITQDRIILLDTQPLMSFALTNYHTQMATAHSGGEHIDIATAASNDSATGPGLCGPGGWSLDVWAEMASLQIVAFLLNCCHVVLVVSDDLGNAPSQLHRLIDRAAGLKPTVYTPSILPPASLQPRRQKCQTKASSMVASSEAPANLMQGYTGLDSTSSKEPTLAGGRAVVACVSESPTDEDGEAEEEEDDNEDENALGADSVSYAPERNRTARSGSDEQDVTVGPSGLLRPHRSLRAAQRTTHLEVESSDVAVALNRLRNLTDYSASLIHVYNQAPSAAFLDPVVRSRLQTYQHQLLPRLFPEYRRFVAMVTIGPRVLSTHLAVSRQRNRSMRKAIATSTAGAVTAPTNTMTTTTTTTTATRMALQSEVTSSDVARTNEGNGAGGNVAPVAVNAPAFSVSTSSSVDFYVSDRSPVGEIADQEPEVRNAEASLPHLSVPSEAEHQSNSPTEQNSSQQSFEPEPVASTENKENVTRGLSKTDLTKSTSVLNVTTSQVSAPTTVSGAGLVAQPDATTASNSGPSSAPQSKADQTRPHGPSEAELVLELRTVLREVEADINELLRRPLTSRRADAVDSGDHANGRLSPDSTLSSSDDGSTPLSEQLNNGERLNARLAQLTHRIQSIRRQFFDVQQRLNHPRLFLVPEVDEEGRPPTGCPSYASSVRLLQEAIMSTPRQHMMLQFTERKWITYAQKMWEAVCTSPLLVDYHAVLTNRA